VNTSTHVVRSQLKQLLDEFVGPVGGQYLRPWMSTADPADSDVLLVGANAATPFPASVVARDRYIELLLAGGDQLRELYASVRADRGPSPTRRNIDRATQVLVAQGARGVLETNVWAWPTPRLSGLRAVDPVVREASAAIVPRLMAIVMPRAVVVHGVEAARGLSRYLGRTVAIARDQPVLTDGDVAIWSIPSLSPPAANRWLPAGWTQLERIGRAITEAR
jgi:hypothetical protein